MVVKYDKVYQFKIELDELKPVIWRRIQVPASYSFWDLHVAIQDSMGWLDCHLHQYMIQNPVLKKKCCIGLPSDEDELLEYKPLAGWTMFIADWFSAENPTARYEYDFGDCWNHIITLEDILPREKGVKYPLCLAGERACPPEDVGSTCGYERFVKIMANPKDEEYKEMLAWYGRKYEPDKFEPGKVKFTNPGIRLRRMFSGGI